MTLKFFVPGIPRPGGSKKAYVLRNRAGQVVLKGGRPIVNITDDAKGNREWKQDVKVFARLAYHGIPLTGPLAVSMTFIMPRLKGHYGTGRNAAALKPGAPTFHTVKPDATKLFRSTEDALTGLLWVDDAQVAQQSAEKVYGDKPGAWITVTPIGAEHGVRNESITEEAGAGGSFNGAGVIDEVAAAQDDVQPRSRRVAGKTAVPGLPQRSLRMDVDLTVKGMPIPVEESHVSRVP